MEQDKFGKTGVSVGLWAKVRRLGIRFRLGLLVGVGSLACGEGRAVVVYRCCAEAGRCGGGSDRVATVSYVVGARVVAAIAYRVVVSDVVAVVGVAYAYGVRGTASGCLRVVGDGEVSSFFGDVVTCGSCSETLSA